MILVRKMNTLCQPRCVQQFYDACCTKAVQERKQLTGSSFERITVLPACMHAFDFLLGTYKWYDFGIALVSLRPAWNAGHSVESWHVCELNSFCIDSCLGVYCGCLHCLLHFVGIDSKCIFSLKLLVCFFQPMLYDTK